MVQYRRTLGWRLSLTPSSANTATVSDVYCRYCKWERKLELQYLLRISLVVLLSNPVQISRLCYVASHPR